MSKVLDSNPDMIFISVNWVSLKHKKTLIWNIESINHDEVTVMTVVMVAATASVTGPREHRTSQQPRVMRGVMVMREVIVIREMIGMMMR